MSLAESDIVVTCACGFTVQGGQDDVVARTQEHGRDVHNMEVTVEQVLAMAQPATA
jgi:predicted small metal-binding protein